MLFVLWHYTNLVFGNIERRLTVTLFCDFRQKSRLSKTRTSATNKITLFISYVFVLLVVYRLLVAKFYEMCVYVLCIILYIFFILKINLPRCPILYYTCTRRIASQFSCQCVSDLFWHKYICPESTNLLMEISKS